MDTGVYVKAYDAPALSRRDILRYAGCREETPEVAALLGTCLRETAECFSYRVCFCRMPITGDGELLDFGVFSLRSKDLSKALLGCDSVFLFLATVGISLDSLIARYSKTSPARACLLQAIGTERIESLCDAFCRDMAAESGGEVCSRFSPGYGDLPLTVQKDVFSVLDPGRRIGVYLNESLLMVPTKSVTAFVGIRENGNRGVK